MTTIFAPCSTRCATMPPPAAPTGWTPLFVGGGTPSLLSPRQWDRLLRGVEQNFRLSRDMEVTVEVNPDSTSQKQLSHLHRLGVNRLSIGAQSFDDTLLKAIGRLHSAQRIRETVREGPPCGL